MRPKRKRFSHTFFSTFAYLGRCFIAAVDPISLSHGPPGHYQPSFDSLLLIDARRRRRLKGIHSRPDTNRTGAEGLSFYYPRLLHCLDQILAVMLLSQHRVSSSKTVRPRAPCGARCIGHAVSTWSAVCSEAPHSQFGEGVRPHLCMDEWNRPTPVRTQLSLTQAARGKPIPTGLALVPGTKARSLEAFSQYSVFHL